MPIKTKHLYAVGGFFVATMLIQFALDEGLGSGLQTMTAQALVTPGASPV